MAIFVTVQILERDDDQEKKKSTKNLTIIQTSRKDKNTFNHTNNQLNKLIKDNKNKSFKTYLEELSTEVVPTTHQKATSRFKHPIVRIFSLKDEDDRQILRDKEKAELFTRHLSKIFQLHDIQLGVKPVKTYKENIKFKYVSPLEVAQIIDSDIKAGKTTKLK